ncbi:MAG: prenyltransferase [Sandaracinaceae bacterium]
MSRWSRWRFAAKPPSWPKILVPALLGQALGVAAVARLDPVALGIGVALAVCDVLFIVFLNDWADRDVDRIKREMFPRSSKKTIPDGVLSARALLAAGALAGLGALAVATVGSLALDRPWLIPITIVGLLVFATYSLPPLRLNYRGGGELLETIGVGLLTPIAHAYLQSGELVPRVGSGSLMGLAALSLASAVASGLSDERSDREGGKRTVVTMLGNRIARALIESLTYAGAALWLLAPIFDSTTPGLAGGGAGALVLVHALAMRRLSRAAETDAFDAQRAYKAELHRGIWRGALWLAMLLAWRSLWP